jgi:hypothetical protein
LRVIVDGALNAVQKERNYRRESTKTMLARLKLYNKFSDSEFTVNVPDQEIVNNRLLVSKFAHGTSFRRLSKDDQTKVGLKILDMESQILFSSERGVAWYDADRHPGNYLIDVNETSGTKHYTIAPIDFGQLTYIRNDQREKVFELNALAAMLTMMGSNDWIAEQVAGLFGIKGAQLNKLKSFMADLFPMPTGQDQAGSDEDNQSRFVVGYFTLIAAINEAIRDSSAEFTDRDIKSGRLDMAYTDFMRAIIQLYQYEDEIQIPDAARTPRKLLTARTLEKVERHLRDVQLSKKQTIAMGIENLRRKLKSQWTGAPYQPIKVSLSRAELSAKFGCDSILAPNQPN